MRLGIGNSSAVAAAGTWRRALALALVAMVALLASLALAGPARASSIFFIRGGNIWVAGPDGSGARQVTTDGTADAPYVSASAAKGANVLAWLRHSPSPPSIFGTIQADGGGLAVAPDNANMQPRAAAPTDSVSIDAGADKLAWGRSYFDCLGGCGYTYMAADADPLADANGSQVQEIQAYAAIDVTFGDPAGQTLLFDDLGGDYESPTTCGRYAYMLVRQQPAPPGSGNSAGPASFYCLTSGDLTEPALRPDGQAIAATETPGDTLNPTGPTEIVTIPIGGTATDGAASPATTVTPAGLAASHPDFSPDGTEIAFEGPGATIYTVPAAGGAPTQILTDAAAPAWSPYSPSAAAPGPSPGARPGSKAGSKSGSKAGAHASASALARAKLAARSVRRGHPVVLKVSLRSAARITVRVRRPARRHGRSHKPRYIILGKLSFRGRKGSNTLRITKVHGHRLAPGHYQALVSAGGKARALTFTVRGAR